MGALFYVKEPHTVGPPGESGTGLAGGASMGSPGSGGAELSLPKLSVYGAVELES